MADTTIEPASFHRPTSLSKTTATGLLGGAFTPQQNILPRTIARSTSTLRWIARTRKFARNCPLGVDARRDGRSRLRHLELGVPVSWQHPSGCSIPNSATTPSLSVVRSLQKSSIRRLLGGRLDIANGSAQH